MDSKEFKKLVDDSGLQITEVAKVLGIGRGTVYNYLKDDNIPETKVDFIRSTLKKDKDKLKLIVKSEGVLTLENVIPFVVENFDEIVKDNRVSRKVFQLAYDLANETIQKEKEKLRSK